MGVTLAKGGNVSLSKAAPNLTQVAVGLGWDVRSTTGAPFGLGAGALLCASGRVLGDERFVFYNNLKSPDGSVEHTGGNLTGESEGDECLLLDLAKARPPATRSPSPSPSTRPTTAARPSDRCAKPSSAREPGRRSGARALPPLRGRLRGDRDGLRRGLSLARGTRRASVASP